MPCSDGARGGCGWFVSAFPSVSSISIVLASAGIAVTDAGCRQKPEHEAPETADTTPSADDETTEDVTEAIVGGKEAAEHPEAALLYRVGWGRWCSGAVISPHVVLTAGHCVVNFKNALTVTAPYAGNQTAAVNRLVNYDYAAGNTSFVHYKEHDIALAILETPITLKTYPTLASQPVEDGTMAVNLGRVLNGKVSETKFYIGPAFALSVGGLVSWSFPYDYSGVDLTQSGDSGGPVELVLGKTKIVAVCSGGGSGSQLVARVDLLYDWIQKQIQLVDPTSADAGSDASVDGDAGSNAGAITGLPAGISCSSLEKEPNGTTAKANGLVDPKAPNEITDATCGTLSTFTDEDWFVWQKKAKIKAKYVATLATKGDAILYAWKKKKGRYYPAANLSPTQIEITPSTATTYIFAVSSPSGQRQAYSLDVAENAHRLTVHPQGTGSGEVRFDGKTCPTNCDKIFSLKTRDSGLPMQLIAKPSNNSTFAGWGAPCESIGTSTTCSFTLDRDMRISASFNSN